MSRAGVKMQKGRLAVAVAALFAVTCATWASSPNLVIDQQQPQVDYSVGGLAIGSGSGQVLAQVFTPATAGMLAGVRMPVGCSEASDLILELQTTIGGRPSGEILAFQ